MLHDLLWRSLAAMAIKASDLQGPQHGTHTPQNPHSKRASAAHSAHDQQSLPNNFPVNNYCHRNPFCRRANISIIFQVNYS